LTSVEVPITFITDIRWCITSRAIPVDDELELMICDTVDENELDKDDDAALVPSPVLLVIEVIDEDEAIALLLLSVLLLLESTEVLL
jgi:hypothetical protein